ncbi:MAG TPA: xylosidase [Myxococcaceae bacterium]|nr:xylosidase [Myxococcaceae bacterium]
MSSLRPSDTVTGTPSGAVLPEANRLPSNTIQGPAGLFDAPSEESRSLRDIVATLQRVPEPLISEPMPDPFVVKLTAQSPGGARTAGLWLLATTNDQPFAFRLYRNVDGRWVPHVVDGQHRAIFPEGKLPAWWNAGEVDPLAPHLPRDLVLARWAPEIDVRNGLLTLHYTARDRAGILRSAYATATAIDGEWTDHGFLDINVRARDVAPTYPGGPAGENPVLGMIDGHVGAAIDADGRERTFLLTKVDGNGLEWTDSATGQRCKAPTPILSHEFRQGADGRIELLGAPRVLFTNGPHHDGLVEGQFVVNEGGRAYVIYSAGFFGNAEYRTYIAQLDLLANTVTGERMLIDSQSRALGGQWNGPGHPSLVKLGQGVYAMYLHVWRNGTEYSKDGDQRQVIQRHVAFQDLQGQACEPFLVEERFTG